MFWRIRSSSCWEVWQTEISANGAARMNMEMVMISIMVDRWVELFTLLQDILRCLRICVCNKPEKILLFNLKGLLECFCSTCCVCRRSEM